MCIRLGHVSSKRLLIFLLPWVFLMVSQSPAYSQNNSRYFPMALWDDPSPDANGKTPNGDISTFFFGHQPQPPTGPTLLIGYNPYYDYSSANVGSVTVDWSRVIAVQVDEPYTAGHISVPNFDDQLRYPDKSFACSPPTLSAAIAPIDAKLAERRSQLKVLAPKARFWVNFTDNEAEWMVQCNALQVFNRSYIDVISADWSTHRNGDNIDSARPFLTLVAQNRTTRPDQQVALIPGVYSASSQVSNVNGFFAYADDTNRTQGCHLPPGNPGLTGFFDGCPVWMVVGWLADSATVGDNTYVGMLDPSDYFSLLIRTMWQGEVFVPLAPNLVRAVPPGKLIQPALELILD